MPTFGRLPEVGPYFIFRWGPFAGNRVAPPLGAATFLDWKRLFGEAIHCPAE